MRDIFEDIFAKEPLDPSEAVRKAMRPQLRKRFYKEARAGAAHEILLDGKPVMTPKRRALAAPNAALAEKIAAEWNAQNDAIDPAAMPRTRLANAIVDGVADRAADVAAEVTKYLGSDLVCYRAEGPEGLVARQAQHWDPIVAFARDVLCARFVLAQGLVHATQPPDAIAHAAAAIPADPWRLGAVAAITSLTGSALIALMLARGKIAPEAAWAAAHVDEDWQMEKWGRDEATLARRAFHRTAFDAAAEVLGLVR